MLTMEAAIHACFKRANYQCERERAVDSWGNTVRCPEKHLEPARTYKGKVVLKPFYESLKHINMDTVRIYCTKCTNEIFAAKRKCKPGSKKVDSNQLNLLED